MEKYKIISSKKNSSKKKKTRRQYVKYSEIGGNQNTQIHQSLLY